MTDAQFIREYSLLIICIAVCAPFASAIGVAVYYRTRYRWGILMQKHHDKGLFK